MAVKRASVKTPGSCAAPVELRGRQYADVEFSAMDGLLWDAALGREFLREQEIVSFEFGGKCRGRLSYRAEHYAGRCTYTA